MTGRYIFKYDIFKNFDYNLDTILSIGTNLSFIEVIKFNNYKVKGFPIATIVNGTIVMENGKIISEQSGKPLIFKL